MARYINAGEFFQTLGFYEQSFDENRDFSARQTILQIMHELEHAPTADVAEVKHGKWVHTDKAMHWTGKDECSECTYHTNNREDLTHFNYCPNCGAQMDVTDTNVGNK